MTDIATSQPQPLAKRALSAHSAIGVAVSAILFILCLSGTLSVFKDELAQLEQPSPHVETLSGEAVMRAAEAGLLLEPKSEHVFVQMPTATHQRAIVHTDNMEGIIDAQGNLVAKRDLPWTDFLIDLHYYLHLPHSFGMMIVALFGVMLFAMSITGLLAHPKIFKDAFAFRTSRSERVRQVDLHNRLAVWTAPFHMSNSLSGAMIGFAGLTAVGIAALDYEGSAAVVFEPIFGSDPAVNEAQAPLARLDLALAQTSAMQPGTNPLYVILHDPKTQGQYVQIMAEHPDRLIYAEKYNFNGAGEFLGTVGSLDGAIGQQVADSVYKVHFGQFGGWGVKIAYGLFGTALLMIIAGGMRIYILRNAAKGRDMATINAAWTAAMWGSSTLMIGLWLVSRLLPLSVGHLKAIFWIGLIVTIGIHIFIQRLTSASDPMQAAQPAQP